MNICRYLVWFASIAALNVSVFAQGSQSISISVDDPRPVASAAERLESLSGRLITYEDPQWIVPDETQDVTESVRRDLAGMPDEMRSKVSRVLIPKGGRLSFSVEESQGFSQSLLRSVLQNVFAANSAAGHPGAFRLLESGGRLHIVPAPQGTTPYRLPLDASISIDERERNGIEILEAICEQLSLTTGQVVTLGTIPVNTFFHHHGFYGASRRNARDLLSSVLDSIGPDYSWQLLFDPGDRVYGLNIHWVRSPE